MDELQELCSEELEVLVLDVYVLGIEEETDEDVEKQGEAGEMQGLNFEESEVLAQGSEEGSGGGEGGEEELGALVRSVLAQ